MTRKTVVESPGRHPWIVETGFGPSYSLEGLPLHDR